MGFETICFAVCLLVIAAGLASLLEYARWAHRTFVAHQPEATPPPPVTAPPAAPARARWADEGGPGLGGILAGLVLLGLIGAALSDPGSGQSRSNRRRFD
jgi:hypothetical protein